MGASDPALAAKPFAVPLSEAYHDEDVPAVRNFAPRVTAAVLIVVIAHYMPIRDIVRTHVLGAVGYHPDSPVTVETQR